MGRAKFILTAITGLIFPFIVKSSSSNVSTGFKVASGEARWGKRLKMKGITLNTLDLKIASEDTAGALLLFEQTGFTPNGGPPLHIHPFQDEFFYIIEGHYQFRVGDELFNMYSGDTIFLPRNIQHAFIQLSDKARVLVSYSPAGKMESFFETTDTWTSPPDEELIKKTFSDHDMIVVGPPLKEDKTITN